MSIFDEPVVKNGLFSVKWNKYDGDDVIPLWLADTDYAAPAAVLDALKDRVSRGIFGYAHAPPALTRLFMERMSRLHGWSVDAESVFYVPGIVPALNLCCQAFAPVGGRVIVPSPIYPPFNAAPVRSGQTPVSVPMVLADGRWRMDWSRLEDIAAKHAKLLLFCNPHNPTGTVYSRAELQRLASIAERHDLIVISDEIHGDLVLDEDKSHVPLAMLSEDMRRRTVTLTGPSKAFNLAGLGCGIVVIEDEDMRRRFRLAQVGVMSGVNALGYAAAEAAYRDGQDWLDAQVEYLRANRDYLESEMRALPGVEAFHVEGTYLAWMDISSLGIDEPERYFAGYGVGISDGALYGAPGFIRLNFGCSRALLQEAVRRVARAILSR